jgi:hypothetical protein
MSLYESLRTAMEEEGDWTWGVIFVDDGRPIPLFNCCIISRQALLIAYLRTHQCRRVYPSGANYPLSFASGWPMIDGVDESVNYFWQRKIS